MPITDRNLPIGTLLVAKYKGQTCRAMRVTNDGDQPMYEVLEPRPDSDDWTPYFKSLSAAGSAIMGGIACNGWRFWSVYGEAPATPAMPAEEMAERTEQGRKLVTFRLFKRTPNQQGTPEGSTRWFCSACMKSFVAEGKEPPVACPEGHFAENHESTTTHAAVEAMTD